MNVTASTTAVAAASTSSIPTTAANQLEESDFLMLLVAELMNQDPLDPLTDRDFIAQMAQLDTLTQTEELNGNMRTMQMLQAASLVGRTIEAIASDGTYASGLVTEVRFIDSQPWLVVNDSTVVNVDDVFRVV